jgi:glutathione synthase/RimK-type ligase-like ATP-grasp enzyme
MNEETKKLLEKVNKKLKDKPLIFFSRDAERSIGLESVLENYYQACIEKSCISDSIESRLHNVLCLNEKGVILKTNSTLELIKSKETSEWIEKITFRKPFYAQLFQFNQPAIELIKKMNGTVLNNSASMNRLFEGKLSQFKFFQENDIKSPEGVIGNISELSYKDLAAKFNTGSLVLQLDRAHTGSGTFFVKNEDEWIVASHKIAGNTVKVNKYIEGDAYTINGCVTKNGTYVAGLQYQITGIKELTPGVGSTVGNDFSYGFKSLDNSIRQAVLHEIKKIGEMLKKENYRGLFGVDFIVNNNEIFIIEINARQTANIPLQTKLELLQNQTPLSLINLAEWLDIDLDIPETTEILPINGSQVFLRSKTDNFEVKNTINSGIYRLQSDNSAKLEPHENIIFLDEEQDKPLIWQEDGYAVDQVSEGGFVLLGPSTKSIKQKFDEIARMQFNNQIVFDGKLSPWIIEAMIEIERRVR